MYDYRMYQRLTELHYPNFVLINLQTNLLLSLEADLRSEFTWNTKQLYIHVDIDFATPNTPINSVVMWNAIVQLKKNAVFKIEELRAMRPFIVTDLDNSLPGTPFNVTVEWEVMPKVGRVYYRSKTFSGFRFPDEYHKLKKISN